MSVTAARIDPQQFRGVLGNYPTGVCVITAIDPEIGPIGMTVGSFTSVSLDPALVAFLPIRESGTYERIRHIGRFCVNVLGSDQDELCRLFARRGENKFADVEWIPSSSGAPILKGAIAWIDCEVSAIFEAGDHDIVVGAVQDLRASEQSLPPLLFFQGGYGKFSTLSLLAGSEDDISAQLSLADRARPYLEQLSQRFDVECLATAPVGQSIIQLVYANAGGSGGGHNKVGLRLPFLPPMGSLFVAWAGTAAIDAWLGRSVATAEPSVKEAILDGLEQIRVRGWASTAAHPKFGDVESLVGHMASDGQLPSNQRQLQDVLSEVAAGSGTLTDPLATGRPVHSISAPVFDRTGSVVLTITMRGLAEHPVDSIRQQIKSLCAAAARLTNEIGGQYPA
ncbi:flavin reductase [Pseudarthrobacter sp. B4EP4b]|uniref:flavin reductase n=1 Tax=Pseudarthrobacter sp. B4EP4b TaxID=2590664 RepID=UPI00114EDA3C|nr:flavin reductase [Pseudarthrobacter sp. B4EP4b]